MLLPWHPWMDDARCVNADAEVFFPEKGGSTREAKRICADCPVIVDCLNHALDNEERFGIWGGLSEQERRTLRRNLDRGKSRGKLIARAVHSVVAETQADDDGDGRKPKRRRGEQCMEGHRIAGDNRWRNGSYDDGNPRYVCRRCRQQQAHYRDRRHEGAA